MTVLETQVQATCDQPHRHGEVAEKRVETRTGVSPRIVHFDRSPQFRALWDAFTDTHPEASFGHSSSLFDWGKAQGVVNRSIAVLDDRDCILGLLPLYQLNERRCRRPWRCLLSSIEFPGGPLLRTGIGAKPATATVELLLEETRKLARQERIDVIDINYPTVIGGDLAIHRLGHYPLRRFGYQEQFGASMVIDLSHSAEELFARLHQTCRNKVRKALSAGAECRGIESKQEWVSSYSLYAETLGEDAISKEQFSLLWDYFVVPGRAFVLGTYLGAEMLSARISVKTSASAYNWMGFRRKKDAVSGAFNLMVWGAIQHAKAGGCRRFEIGSLNYATEKLATISEFKRSFGGENCYQLRGRYLCRPLRDAAFNLAENLWTAVRRRPQGMERI